MQAIDVSTMCDRIALKNPYFAFLELERQSSAAVRGTFAPEHRTGHERGSIAAAELVRHLATLGSCAAVVEGAAAPAYYLGTKGRLRLLRNTRSHENSALFQASSEVVEQDRRSLVAHCVLSDPGVLAHFHCEYQVLPEAVFARTFKSYRSDAVPDPDSSPYKEPIELDFESPQGLSLTAHSRPLPKGRFAGHFFGYPAWPASIYAETVSRVVGRLLHHMLGKEVDYSVVRLDVDALRLISGAEGVSFHVTCTSASQILSHYVFSSEVRWSEVVAATIEMEVHV